MFCSISKCGEIDEIRLIKDYKGRSKGYAYVQFKDEVRVIKLYLLNLVCYECLTYDYRIFLCV